MKYLLTFFLFVALPLYASAQQLIPQDVTVRISPEVPQPLSNVSFVIESFVIDIDRSNITWVVDGEVKQSVQGDKDFTFVTGPVGSQHSVQLIIETQGGEKVSKDFQINPGQVDLLWESTDSYTPLLYRGKALNAHESGIKIAALPYFLDPGGKQINPKTMIYTWTVNKKIQLASSGLGRDTFTFLGPSLYRDALVTVDVESGDGKYVARRSINLKAQPPKILYYVNDPLQGVSLVNALKGKTLDLIRDEMVVTAVPYFLSNIEDQNTVQYTWTIDGKKIITVGDRNEINLRRPETGSGRSTVSLEIKNVKKILQFARESFTAVFAEKINSGVNTSQDTNFFGL